MLARMTPPVPSPAAEQAVVPTVSRRAYLLALLVLVGALLLVALYARIAGQREDELARAHFEAEARQLAVQLQQRLLVYELTVRGGVSLFATVDRPTPVQWRSYVDGLDLEQRFGALMGLGFAQSLTRTQLQQLQLEMRDSGGGLFSIRPPGIRERYGPIVYLEPRTPENISALGYDMFSDPVRAEAMAAARDTGQARMTGGVQLVQDGGQSGSTGLLIYAPVYRAGVTPAGIAARRDAFSGWVYTLFRMQRYVASALGDPPPQLSLRIVDVTGGREQLLYTTADAFAGQADAGLRHSIESEIYGRKWRFDFASHVAGHGIAAGITGVQTTIAIGMLASLLLYAVMLSLARTELRAQQIAARLGESYRRSELRFRNAMQYSAIGQALLDRHGTIVDTNLALADILRSSPDELAGTSFHARFVDGRQDVSETGQLRVAEVGVYQATRQLRRNDGELRHVRVTFTPVPGDAGQSVDSLVQVEDVTERLRAEAQVNALNRTLEARVALRTRELSQANEELQSFAYSVSHDLSAPLRSIDGFSRLLSERYAGSIDETGQGYLARVRAAATRMNELIEALLKMSRLSRSALNHAALDLSRIAEEVVAELRAAEPGREVAVAIEPGLRATGDAALVRNLLLNLLGNAWKFTGQTPGARIEFGMETASRDEAAVEGMRTFFVRDNGAGFDPGYVDKLFRPFQRLHSQHEFSGHGIGLASVKRIVERHGGSISAEGGPGQGATFRFTLPDAGS